MVLPRKETPGTRTILKEHVGYQLSYFESVQNGADDELRENWAAFRKESTLYAHCQPEGSHCRRHSNMWRRNTQQEYMKNGRMWKLLERKIQDGQRSRQS